MNDPMHRPDPERFRTIDNAEIERELQALREICKALDPFTPHVRQRILLGLSMALTVAYPPPHERM